MTAPLAELRTPLRRAKVVVVLHASDHDHYAVSGEAPFRAACPPWADLRFVADHDIADELVALLAEGNVDTVVFASNSLTSAAARRVVAHETFTSRWADDPSRDVGVLVLHQFLTPNETLPLRFLDSAAFSLVGEPPRGVKRERIRFPSDWRFTDETPRAEREDRFRALARGYGKKGWSLWARSEPRYPVQWDPIVWEENGDPLIAACDAGDRLVIASRLPLDVTGHTALLQSLIAACLRPRGCLLVQAPATSGSTAFTPALASAIERGRFVHHVGPCNAGEIDPDRSPYTFFEELIVAPEWHMDQIPALSERAILRKLERGGSLVVTFSGPGGSAVTVRLSGQPQYAQRANQLASWLAPRLDAFKGDLWSTRGLAAVVAATREAFEDPRLIPQALRADYVSRHVADRLAARVRRNNVDDNVLATLGAVAAMRVLGVKGHDKLLAWAARRIDDELGSIVAQAMILVPEFATDKRRNRVLAAAKGSDAGSDDPRLLRAYAAALFADTEPELVRCAASDASLGLSVQAELLGAVARKQIAVTDEIVGMAAHVRDRIDRLALAEGGLEAVCLGNAALIELARRQGIGPTTAVRGRPREVDARTIENTELARQREEALRDKARYERAGRRAITVLVGILMLVTVAAVAAIFIWSGGDIGTKWGFAAGVFTVMSTLIGYVIKRTRAAGLPPYLSGQASG